MKTTILLLASMITFWSCGQPETKTETPTEAAPSAAMHEHETEASGLQLNNGAKWVADESTNTQVKNLQEILTRFEAQPTKSLEVYHSTGKELQSGIESLIQGCRMQGPDHDALHHWLEPLMNQVKSLNESTTVDQAETNYQLIQEQVALYPKYFA